MATKDPKLAMQAVGLYSRLHGQESRQNDSAQRLGLALAKENRMADNANAHLAIDRERLKLAQQAQQNTKHQRIIQNADNAQKSLLARLKMLEETKTKVESVHFLSDLDHINPQDPFYRQEINRLKVRYSYGKETLAVRQAVTFLDKLAEGNEKIFEDFRKLDIDPANPKYRVVDPATGDFDHMNMRALNADAAPRRVELLQREKSINEAVLGPNASSSITNGKVSSHLDPTTQANKLDGLLKTPGMDGKKQAEITEAGLMAVKQLKEWMAMPKGALTDEQAELVQKAQTAQRLDDNAFTDFKASVSRDAQVQKAETIASALVYQQQGLASAKTRIAEIVKDVAAFKQAHEDTWEKEPTQKSWIDSQEAEMRGLMKQIGERAAGTPGDTTPPAGKPAKTDKYFNTPKGAPSSPVPVTPTNPGGGYDFKAAVEKKVTTNKPASILPSHFQTDAVKPEETQAKYNSEDAQTKRKALLDAAEEYRNATSPDSYKLRIAQLTSPDRPIYYPEAKAKQIAREEFDSQQKGLIGQLNENGITDPTHHALILDVLNKGGDFSLSDEGANKPPRAFVQMNIGGGKTGMRPVEDQFDKPGKVLPEITPVAPPIVPIVPAPETPPNDLYQPRD